MHARARRSWPRAGNRFAGRGSAHSAALLLGLTLVGTGCTQTRYVDYAAIDADQPFPYRTVAYDIDREFYADFPDCVIVMPVGNAAAWTADAALVEQSLARHLTSKFSRVVGPTERAIAARDYSVDLAELEDRKVLAAALRCDTFAYPTLTDRGNAYLIVVSQARIGLEVRLVRASDTHVLWRARHIAERTAGGFPFSPFSAVANGVSSARLRNDREVAISVIDDAIRRVVAPLPDAREFD